MTTIHFAHITKRFGSVSAVDDVTLQIDSGKFYSLVGPSGCGKTTLLRIAAGLVPLDAGTLLFDGKPVNDLAPSRRNIGFVFQNYALFPTKTVEQNIAFSLTLQRRSRRFIRERVGEMAAMMDISACLQRYPHELSGGQQQRVALARALASNPSVLLLDEPLSALDAKIRAHLRTEIRQIVDTIGMTAVYVTHDQEEAMAISDQIAVMDHGRILQVGAPAEVYLHPENLFVAQFIGLSNVLPCRVLGCNTVQIGDVCLEAHTNGMPLGPGLLAVRPEHIAVQDTSLGSGLQGVLRRVSFLGNLVRLTFQVFDSLQIQADIQTVSWLRKQIEAGTCCSLGFRSDLATVFPQQVSTP